MKNRALVMSDVHETACVDQKASEALLGNTRLSGLAPTWLRF